MKFPKIILGLIFCIAAAGPCEPLAFSKSGGGFSSSKSSSSSGWGGSKSSSGWGGSSSSISKSSGWGSSSSSVKSTPSSSNWGGSGSSWFGGSSSPSKSSGFSSSKTTRSVDSLSYDRAKASGTTYTNKTQAISAFKNKYSSQYTSKFDKEPSSRPSYIPTSTIEGGKNYNITYNAQYGGYGYMGPSGSWVMYDTMRDAAMLSVLMGNHNYYYGSPPPASGLAVAILFFISCFVFLLIVAFIFNRFAS